VKHGEGYKIPLLRQKVSCGPGEDWQTEENIKEYIDIFSLLPKHGFKGYRRGAAQLPFLVLPHIRLVGRIIPSLCDGVG